MSITLTAICQIDSKETWSMEFGASKNISYNNFTGVNLRIVSPKFQITGEDPYWTEEEEKHPKRFKKFRFNVELMYAPAFNVNDGNGNNFIRINTPGLRIQNILVSRIHKDTLPIYYVSNSTQLKEYAVSGNIQYRILEYHRLSVQVTGGLKFFFLTSPNYGLVNSKQVYYLNIGLLSQLNLGWISPFMDIGIDRIYTIGAEVKFNEIFRNAKRRYKLNLQNSNKAEG